MKRLELLFSDEVCEKLRSIDPDKAGGGVDFSHTAREQINVLQDQCGDDFERILVCIIGRIPRVLSAVKIRKDSYYFALHLRIVTYFILLAEGPVRRPL